MLKIILPALLLTACQSVEPVQGVKVLDNKKKDEYIDRLEREAGSSAAALVVALPSIEGKGRSLVELTADRLTGIQTPTKAELERFAKAIGDDRALKSEQDKAKKVDDETSAIYGMVEAIDEENRNLKDQIDAMKREQAWGELRTKFLGLAGVFAFAGAAMFVLSNFVGKGKASAFMLIGLAVFFGAAPYAIRQFVEAPWFPYATIAIALLGALWGAWAYYHTHCHLKTRLTDSQKAPDLNTTE